MFHHRSWKQTAAAVSITHLLVALAFLKGGWHDTGLWFSVFIHNLLPWSTTVRFVFLPHDQKVSAKMTALRLFARILVSQGFLHAASGQDRVYSNDLVDSCVQVGTEQVFAEVSCSAGYSHPFNCSPCLCTSFYSHFPKYCLHNPQLQFLLHPTSPRLFQFLPLRLLHDPSPELPGG